MSKKLTLGKNERLKSRKQIDLLFTEGKKFSVSTFRVFYLFNASSGQPLQFAVGVSNKNFKKAVDRNKIKRRIREAYRLQKISLQRQLKDKKCLVRIFIIYTGKEITEYSDVFAGIKKILEKLSHLVNSEK